MNQLCARYLIFLSFSVIAQSSVASTCFGSTAAGRLEGACNLPGSGKNFTTYSTPLRLAGRTYVHCDVRAIILESYGALESKALGWQFVYGETGKKNGGQFKPHKTHQNGLSVDFMTPVMNKHGESVKLPTSIFNKYGYDIDFTVDGNYKDLSVDYEALAAHLAELKTSASQRGVGIWRVLFDPNMQSPLKNTKAWAEISDLKFSTKRSWVRHDDHYHVDFIIPCKAL